MHNVFLRQSMITRTGRNVKAMRLFCASLLLCLLGTSAFAAVTVTTATGGTNICHNKAGDGTAPAYTALGTITISEGLNNDFSAGFDQVVISAPAGWQFNTGSTPTITGTGGDILSAFNLGFTSSTLTVELIVLTGGNHDVVTITGLQIQPITMAAAAGNIYATSSAGINGLAAGPAGTNFGSLSQSGPTVFNVTGGGGYCIGGAGADIQLTGSDAGVSYQLYNGGVAAGSPSTGTGAAPFDLGLQTAAGTYTVRATDGTGCTSNMGGSVSVVVNPLPTVYNVAGGGAYCAGGSGVFVTLSFSDVGINYRLYNGATYTGVSTPGASSSLSFGPETAAGTYTVQAQNATTGCTSNMTGSATVSVTALPTAYTVTGPASYCADLAGADIQLINSETGVNYQLYNGVATVGASQPGTTGSAIDFGTHTAGSYSVLATTAAGGCTAPMLNTLNVVIDPLPTVYNVGGGGGYCAGGAGAFVTLSFSDVNVNYNLYYNGALSSTLPGASSSLSFGPESGAGTYTVQAVNASTGCISNMSGSAVVSINPLPIAYTVTGATSYCADLAGVAVGLSNSQTGVSYQLYNGVAAVGPIVAGSTGSALSFGVQPAGSYSVLATAALGGCTSPMLNTLNVIMNPLPIVYTVGGGGDYCAGGAGVQVTLSNSQVGVNYQLYLGVATTGAAVAGTGATPTNLGLQTAAGTYTVFATNATTGCTANMTGSATVSIDPLPATFTLTASGSSSGHYCAGGTGVDLSLNGSQIGVNYQLYYGASPIGAPVAGTGTPELDLGFQTGAGTYSVLASSATTPCTNNMIGIVTVSIDPLPAVHNLSAGGGYCIGGAGVDLTLDASDAGINYQLYYGAATIGGATAGGASPLDLGFQTGAGTYSVRATNATTGCVSNMAGTATVSINPLPAVFTVGGGGSYCAGGAGLHITLSNSEVGVNYQLYNTTTAVGGLVAGTGVPPLDLGLETAGGVYTVSAINATTGCTSDMSGIASIYVNPLPTTFAISAGGSYCAGDTGVHLALYGSQVGVNYQLFYNGTSVGSSIAGNADTLDFGLQTAAGTYSILATDAVTLCTSNMTGTATVSINPLPTVYTISAGGPYCAGGPGVDLTLSGSDAGVNYQLYYGATAIGSPVAGGTTPLDLGMQTGAGTYTVFATNATTSCKNDMFGTALITITPLPTAYTVTGGGAYCVGGPGVHVTLSNSDTGVSYQLFVNGVVTGPIVAGTGVAPLDFGLQTIVGTYTVFAINYTTTCSNNMTGSVIVTTNPLPTVYAISAGGSYCAGGTGVDLTLSGSDTGVSYQLYYGSTATGSAVAGTGSVLDLGFQTSAGTYSVSATNNITLCTNNMSGTATVSINPLPTAFTVTGGGGYCVGGTGVSVGLSNSTVGVNYQLFYGSSPIGGIVAGTGSPLDFGLQTGVGVYSVSAQNQTTGCTNNMANTVDVFTNPLPAVYDVTGGGAFCAGGAGFSIGLSNSDIGINYQLFTGGFPVGALLHGTGSALDFGVYSTDGTYIVMAINSVTGCFIEMNGSAVITVNPLPIAYTVAGGGTMCAGSAGFDITLNNSETGVNYQLYINTLPYGTAVAGTTGSAIDFGVLPFAGTYVVVGTNATTGCNALMLDSAVVVVNPAPGPITGVTNICQGITTTLIDTPAGGGWSSNDFTIAYINATTGVLTGVGAGVTIVTYTLPNTCFATTVVTVNQTPSTFTVSGGGSMCEGGAGFDVNLSGSETGISYQLYINTLPYGTPVAGTGSPLDFGTFGFPGTYLIVGFNSTLTCNALMADSAVIVVNPLPGTINGNTSVCVNASVTLSDTTAGGTWSSDDISRATIDGAGVLTGVAGGFTTITYTAASGCYVTTAVTANSLPVVPAITGVTHQCFGSTSVLADATTGGVWSSTDNTIASVDTMGVVSGVNTGVATISYTITDANGCVGAATTPDTVNALPVVSAITGPTSICMGATVTLEDATTGGVWTSSDITIATIGAGTGKASGISTGTVIITYTVTDINGCTGIATTTETVNPMPAVNPILGPANVCAGLTIALADSTAGGEWQSSDPTILSVDSTGTVSGVMPGSAVLYYVVTDSLGCMNAATSIVTVGDSMPASSILPASASVTLCGGPVNLVLTTAGGSLTYQWSVDGINIAGATNGNYVTDTAGFFTITLNNGTCSATLSGTSVIAQPSPVVVFDSAGNFLATTMSYATYQWYVNGAPITGATNSTYNNPGTGTYKVVVSDSNSCFVGSSDFAVVSATEGVKNAISINVRIYPNPATSTLSVEAPVVVSVSILSPDGKVVMEQQHATALDVSELADGMYIIMVYDQSNSLLKTEKFVKMK